MAVTSIWPIKGKISKVINYAKNPEKTTETFDLDQSSLHVVDGVVEYAANDMKTEQRYYVTCIHCTEESAAQQFMETKKAWSYTRGEQTLGGRVCFHGYQSFAAGEVTAETAHEIGVELTKRLWGDDFEAVIATHCNTGHFHNHIIINSVSWRDGHRFHNGPDDYERMREESDRLCLEYGLSVIEDPQGRGKNYKEYQAELNGLPTVRGFIRADIDRAVSASLTYEEFFSQLTEMGYEIKLFTDSGKRLKYPGLKPPGAKGFFRFHKLGLGYDLESIGDRLLSQNRRQVPFPEEEIRAAWRYRRENRPKVKLKGFYALYIRYCFELGVIRKFPASAKRVSSFMREDLANFEKLNDMTTFLGRYKIETLDDLNDFRDSARNEIAALETERIKLRNKQRREQRAAENTGETKSAISAITQKIRSKRHELKLADDVEGRSRQMALELELLGIWNAQELGKEERNEHVLIGRSRTSREDDA